jgi:hypothetical protein
MRLLHPYFPYSRTIALVLFLGVIATGYGQVRNGVDEMGANDLDILNYYRQPGIVTQPGEYVYLLANLPDGIPELCRIVQGVILHIFWAPAYGVKLSEERQKEVNLRRFEYILKRLSELSDQPVNVLREPSMRVVGNCRDYSVVLCALLKYKGIPARARCGFATYFTPHRYEDHWICEYWDEGKGRWVRVDAQLDSIQIEHLKIDFNPYDLPEGKFLSGAETWRSCRSGELDPDLCGIFDMNGLWFVQGDLVRDFMALNGLEVLPWDCNEIMGGPDVQISPDDYELLDLVAELINGGDTKFREMRSLYESNERLHMPADWQP